MDRAVAENAIAMMIGEMRTRLDDASGIARAAQVCANEGNIEKAVEIALDVEQLSYEASNLLNAASTINRMTKKAE
jgi:hypothetical protein